MSDHTPRPRQLAVLVVEPSQSALVRRSCQGNITVILYSLPIRFQLWNEAHAPLRLLEDVQRNVHRWLWHGCVIVR
jgi:hypothetical protein